MVAGSLVWEASVRMAPTRTETIMAAGRPLPATSPMTMSRPPSGMGRIWKKSPPTSSAGMVDAIDGKARHGGDGFWDEDLLDLAGGLELGGIALFPLARLSESPDEEGEQGGEKDQVDQDLPVHAERRKGQRRKQDVWHDDPVRLAQSECEVIDEKEFRSRERSEW